MPSLTTLAPFCAVVLPMWTMLSPWSKTITWLLLSRLQGNKPNQNSPEPSEPCLPNLHQHAPELSEPSGTFRTLPPEPRPTRAGTLRNPPEPSKTFRNQPVGTFRNLPPEPTPAYTSTLRNLPEPSETCLRNLHQHTPEPSGTFRNPPPEPTPAHAGTLRNLPEPASGTYTSTRRNPPEPSWTFLRNLLLRPAPVHTGAYLGWRPH